MLEYAQRNAVFPNDGTDKQWFRANTFTAYQQLGRRTGERMLGALPIRFARCRERAFGPVGERPGGDSPVPAPGEVPDGQLRRWSPS